MKLIGQVHEAHSAGSGRIDLLEVVRMFAVQLKPEHEEKVRQRGDLAFTRSDDSSGAFENDGPRMEFKVSVATIKVPKLLSGTYVSSADSFKLMLASDHTITGHYLLFKKSLKSVAADQDRIDVDISGQEYDRCYIHKPRPDMPVAVVLDEAVIIELSPEPLEAEILPEPVVGATAHGEQYHIIGQSWTADTIAEYTSSTPVARGTRMTVLHNSATPAAQSRGLDTVKSFHRYHTQVRKWKAIGYHWVIDVDGTIYGARKMEYMGAHAGHDGNPGSMGVCLVGNFETTDKPTEAQKGALVALHNALDAAYYGGKGPDAVRFHREFMDTACPGKITRAEVNGWF